MDTLSPYLEECRKHFDTGIQKSQEIFNHYIQYVDFPLFCVIYSLFMLWFLKKLNRPAIFRPKNKEIITWKESMKKNISTFIVNLPGIKQYLAKKMEKGLAELEEKMIIEFEKSRDPLKSKKLPLQGMKTTNIESRINKWFDLEKKLMFTGKNSGSIYPQSNDFCQEVSDFAAKYMYHNPLHLDTYKEVGKMQAELLKMTGSLISKNKVYGVITSGGSESLIMSIYAYRKQFNKPKPNIVVPQTIHAAVDKGAMYFNIELRKAKLNQNYEVDINHMQSLIDSNTIALYASYPNYPHGIIDPVVQIGQIAKKHKIGFHIDGCLGGLVAGFLKNHEGKFTLDIDGATSISLDHHKFGLAPKGISTVFFKTKELRQQMYFIYTDWVGGVYITPSFNGSRSGFASAGAWYCFTHIGRKNYLENALAVVDATKTAAKQLRQIDGVKVLGNPQLCVLSFYSENIDCFTLSSALTQKSSWKIPGQHLPSCIHVSVTISNYYQVKHSLAKDVKAAIEYLKSQPPKESQMAALYGASSSLPSQDMGDDMVKAIMISTFK